MTRACFWASRFTRLRHLLYVPLPPQREVPEDPGNPEAARTGIVGRLVLINPPERRLVAWAWLYLFSVFSAYYIIRPIRDEAGVAGGVANLSWLFTGTLVAMMVVNPPFAALVARLPRSRFIGLVYRFFI